MANKIHPVYTTKSAAEAGVSFPTSAMVPLEFYDYALDHGVLSGEAFTVPAASPYQLQGPIVVPQSSLSLTVNGGAREVVAGDSVASGQVGYDAATGVLTFHSSDAGLAGTWTGTPMWTRPRAGWVHWMQGHIKEIEEEILAEAATSLTRNPNVVHVTAGGNDTTGNGSIVAPFATVGKAFAIIDAAEEETAWVVNIGPGAYEWELTTDNTNLVGEDVENNILGYGVGTGRYVSLRGYGATLDIDATEVFEAATEFELAVEEIEGLSIDLSGNSGRFSFGAYLKSVFDEGIVAPLVISNATISATGAGPVQLYAAASEIATSHISNSVVTVSATLAASLSVFIPCVRSKLSAPAGPVVTCGDGSVGRICDCFINATGAAGNIALTALRVAGNRMRLEGAQTATVTCESFDANVIDGAATSKVTVVSAHSADNHISAGSVKFTASSLGPMVIVNNHIHQTATAFGPGGIIDGSFPYDVVIDGNTIIDATPFDESPDGTIATIRRLGGAGTLYIRNNEVQCKGIFLMDSHPSVDLTRHTTDKHTFLFGNRITCILSASAGPEDVHACVLRYARGVLHSQGNSYMFLGAASTNTDKEHCAFFVDSNLTSGTSVVTSVNDHFAVTLPAGVVTGADGTNGKSAICFRLDGANEEVSATVINPTIKTDGNETTVFAGLGSGKVAVRGTINCNLAITYQNAPDGGVQAIRGTLAVSGNISAANLSGTNTGDNPPSDVAYNATTWDGVTTVAPSKNAVRDKLEAMTTSIVTKADDSSVVHLAGSETVTGAKSFTGGLSSVSDLWQCASAAFGSVLSGATVSDYSSVDFPEGASAARGVCVVPGTIIKAIGITANGDDSVDITVALRSRAVGSGTTAWTTVESHTFSDVSSAAPAAYTHTLASAVTTVAGTEYVLVATGAGGDATLYAFGWQTSTRKY